MWEELLKIIPIVLMTMFKFIFGPTLGYAAGFSYIKTVLVTISGTMLSVFIFSYFGTFMRDKVIRRYFPPKRKFSKRSRRSVTIWQKYGLIGAAVLMPLILTPIGGTILAIGFGETKERVVLYMFVSTVFWTLIFSGIIYFLGREFLPV